MDSLGSATALNSCSCSCVGQLQLRWTAAVVLDSCGTSKSAVVGMMAMRALGRLGLDELATRRLGDVGVRTAADLLGLGALEVAELLDLDPKAAGDLMARVSADVAPRPTTVLALHQTRGAAGTQRHVPTLLQGLDAALRGGVPPGAITELVGPAGVGKTQMCFMVTLSALVGEHLQQQRGAGNNPADGQGGGSVLYIDTERKFSAARLAQMAAARFPQHFPGGRDDPMLHKLLQHVLVVSPANTRELTQRLQDMEHSLIERRVKLVLLDSVASLARVDFGVGETLDRQQQLSQQAALLKHYADTFQVPVVVTNHVTTTVGGAAVHDFQQPQPQHQGAHVTAALGALWAHAVNIRLVMQHGRQGRTIQIAKSPSAPHVSFPYDITTAGIEPASGLDDDSDGGGGGAGRGVVGMQIDNFVQYMPPGQGG